MANVIQMRLAAITWTASVVRAMPGFQGTELILVTILTNARRKHINALLTNALLAPIVMEVTIVPVIVGSLETASVADWRILKMRITRIMIAGMTYTLTEMRQIS